MIARIAILGIVMSALIAAVALYYLQVYAFYVEVAAEDAGNVLLTSLHSGVPELIPFENFKAIDADSSPIRFRACFETPFSQATLTETYEAYPQAEPLTAPRWFDCFRAGDLGAALSSGEAIALLGERNVHYGIDRVVAVTPDGRGYIWHQINSCGAAVFNGDAAPEGCPPLPERSN